MALVGHVQIEFGLLGDGARERKAGGDHQRVVGVPAIVWASANCAVISGLSV
jgi:hypothetical protein